LGFYTKKSEAKDYKFINHSRKNKLASTCTCRGWSLYKIQNNANIETKWMEIKYGTSRYDCI